MIQLLSKVKIIDNSGGIEARCIKILKPKNVNHAKIGDIILVTILNSLSSCNIKKGDLYKALIVRAKTSNKRCIGWNDNAVILLSSKELSPIGSRIKSPISKQLTLKKGNLKYTSLAKIII